MKAEIVSIITGLLLSNTSYPWHRDISVTIFWAGENASGDNGGIANIASVWDDMWMLDYGGVDAPDARDGYLPAGFVPFENPFYFALPYNDFNASGQRKPGLNGYIPWAKDGGDANRSVCKNRWIEIVKDNRTAYAQWEDAGPFGEDDVAYVFGDARPANTRNDHAGLDVSPAVRDYLGLSDLDRVDWRFVDETDVPPGPWKTTVTASGVNWTDWYRPDVNTSWQWQLTGDVNTSYDVDIYDIDLFDSNATLIDSLHARGIRVVCYFSAGSYEEWRSDADRFPDAVLGNDLDGWAGEKWLDIRALDILLPIMTDRLDLAAEKGCDGVEPDNVDGYTNDTGFDLTAADQLVYNKHIANEAHRRGLAVGLKNDLDQIGTLEPFFDFALNEQCHEYDECGLLAPFVSAGKPVFNAEYASRYVDNDRGERDALCDDARDRNFSTLVLPQDLDDSFRYSCGD